jgi:lipoate-protein ligase A
MAADQLLLESAAAGIASLRFYGWSEPTLSLGYFQPERLRHTYPRLAVLPYVRRPTGGETLVHHHELTYALGLPAGPPWQAPGEKAAAWLSRMHAIISRSLRELDIPVQLAGKRSTSQGGFLCFQHPTQQDVLIGQDKVVGSAQRHSRGGLLQHGAILLATSPYTPSLPGIQELTGKKLSLIDAREAIAREFARDCMCKLTAGDWTPNEQARIDELAQGQYSNAAWNAKR